MKIGINEIIINFKNFLEASWEPAAKFFEGERSEDLLADWMQTNWEFLVETKIFYGEEMYLEVYGDGADCNENGSRVWQPEKMPTHQIYCKSRMGNKIFDFLSGKKINLEPLIFDQFVSWKNDKYDNHPPFQYILLEKDNNIYVVLLEEIEFDIREFND